MKDDRFYDKLKHTDKIMGRSFFQVYPPGYRFIRFDPMSGKINILIDPLDMVAEASNFIQNHHQILNQVKKILQPKNFLAGVGSLLLNRNSMTPGEVLQNPISLLISLEIWFIQLKKAQKKKEKRV